MDCDGVFTFRYNLWHIVSDCPIYSGEHATVSGRYENLAGDRSEHESSEERCAAIGETAHREDGENEGRGNW